MVPATGALRQYMSGSLALGSSQDGLCTVTVSVTARIRKLIHVGYSYESIQFRYTAPLPRPTPCISAPQLYRHPRSPVTNYPAQAFRSENAITSRTTITRPGSRPPPSPRPFNKTLFIQSIEACTLRWSYPGSLTIHLREGV